MASPGRSSAFAWAARTRTRSGRCRSASPSIEATRMVRRWPPDRARLDQLDEARHLDRADLALQNRGTHRLGAQLGGGYSAGKRQQCHTDQRPGALPSADHMQHQSHDYGQQRNRRRRLHRQRKVQRDAGPEQHRQPQEPALLLRLKVAHQGARAAAIEPVHSWTGRQLPEATTLLRRLAPWLRTPLAPAASAICGNPNGIRRAQAARRQQHLLRTQR